MVRMRSALANSWSAMNCRGPTATPSVLLPAVAVETEANSRTSSIFHVVDYFCFLRVSSSSNFLVGVVKFVQVGRHEDWVTEDVTIIHVPEVR